MSQQPIDYVDQDQPNRLRRHRPVSQPFDWIDFEPEPYTTGDGSGDPDKYILTIRNNGEEYAVIVHRTVGGKYPLDGVIAQEKRDRASYICQTLNDNERW